MSNIANIQKLHYCDKKSGNRSKCANVATRQTVYRKKGSEIDITAKTEYGYRCEKHAKTPTANNMVIESLPLDQSFALTKINIFLRSIVGKNIISKIHGVKQLKVKYVKPENCGIMCINEKSNKYKFVYYDQINTVL